MVVGVGIIDIYIFDSRSLKSKRGVLRSILKRTQNRFNISIAEVGDNNNWKRGRIGFSIVGNDTGYVNSKMNKILKFIDHLELAEVVNSKIEITGFSDLVEQCDYMKDIVVSNHDEL
ncbi:MAG: DUF503 domain-containing protein [Thermodesulfobacteriota bacterium]|nr:DUF503 domain-containing protein [Thermodesulfobacteriota bacterium]